MDGCCQQCEVESSMGSHGRPQRSGQGAAECKDSPNAHHERDCDDRRHDPNVISRRVMKYSVETKVNKAKQKGIDQERNDRIKPARECLLYEPAKKYLFADRVQKDGRQSIERKDGGWRHKSAHFIEVEIVADTDAPVIRRIAIDHHPGDKEPEATCRASKRTQEHGADCRASL